MKSHNVHILIFITIILLGCSSRPSDYTKSKIYTVNGLRIRCQFHGAEVNITDLATNNTAITDCGSEILSFDPSDKRIIMHLKANGDQSPDNVNSVEILIYDNIHQIDKRFFYNRDFD